MISLLTISLGVAVSIAAVSGSEKKANPNTLPIAINFRAQDWEISPEQAQKMVEYYQNCNGTDCFSYKKINKNKAVKKQIRSYNDIAWINFRIRHIKARYTKEDEERYSRLRGIKEGDPRGRVGGYATKILRVRTKKHRVNMKMNTIEYREFADFFYYDLASICPPPDPC